jgi:hypothetical protein
MQEPLRPAGARSIDRSYGRTEEAAGFEARRLAALVLLGTLALLVWLAVVLAVPPHRLLTYLAFFVPFWIFVAAFTAAGLYWFSAGRWVGGPSALRNSVRRGAIAASVVVANLALTAAHKWQLLAFLIVLAAAGVAELAGWVRPGNSEA